MANLQTLEGISQAREKMYNDLEAGKLDEKRAVQMERSLRGQESLKASVPIRLLAVVQRMKGSQAERYVSPLVKRLLVFTGASEEDIKALDAPKQ